MEAAPSYEDAITAGMNAFADGITRSIDSLVLDSIGSMFRGLFGRRSGAAREPAPSAETSVPSA